MTHYKAIGTSKEYEECSCCGRKIKSSILVMELEGENVISYSVPFGVGCAAKVLGMKKPDSKKTQTNLIAQIEKELKLEKIERYKWYERSFDVTKFTVEHEEKESTATIEFCNGNVIFTCDVTEYRDLSPNLLKDITRHKYFEKMTGISKTW